MAVYTDKGECLLRWSLNDTPHKTALCRVRGGRDHLPANSCIFSAVPAETAAALSMSACDRKLVRENLSALGYGDILCIGYEQSEPDKIGVCIASRRKDDQLEVAVVLRGTCGSEWYSNFDVGYSAEHSGFAKAADFAELAVGDYIFTRAVGIRPTFFVTGYSRGGAVANILSKRLIDRYGIESVCAYTFASPATTISRRGSRYSSIFNLVRMEDFFTRVPLVNWGYTRYGHDISLSDKGDITAPFRALTGEEYIGFTRQAATDNFLCALMTLAPNVHAYYERRKEVSGRRLSLYEFMRSVADMLSNHIDETVTDVLLSAMISDYADLVSFLSSGADLNELIGSAAAVPRCSVADSHSPAAYMASLQLLLHQ